MQNESWRGVKLSDEEGNNKRSVVHKVHMRDKVLVDNQPMPYLRGREPEIHAPAGPFIWV